jgi:hypothetical protein
MDRFMGHEEDREQRFEQALARHLREAAGAREDAGNVAGACPDAEVLAAFHERMLSSEEMNAVKEHVAACSQCQEILAHLETSDDVVMEADQEIPMELRRSVLSNGGLYGDYASRQNPSLTVAAGPASTVSAPRSISSGRGGKLLRWVAPAGAIAAGLLIWAVVRDKPHELAPVQNIQVAQQRAEDERAAIPQPPKPQASLRSDRADQLSRVEDRKLRPAQGFGTRSLPAEEQSQLTDRVSKDGPGADGAAGGTVAGRLATEELARADKYLREAKPAAAPKSVAKTGETVNAPPAAASAPAAPAPTADARQSGDKQTKNLPTTGRNEVTLSPDADKGKKAPTRERDTLSKEKLEPGVAGGAPAPTAPPGPMSESVTVQSAAETSQKPAQKKDEDSKANTEVVTTAQAEVSASYARTSAALKGKVVDDSKIIVTPGGTALWRLQPAGIIERSVDRGLAWSRQDSGTTRGLLAGSAPSDVVCWIVGRRGLILRTTDGGGHWEKVTAPVAEDFSGIRATDALHATILDHGGRAKFVTSDGGVNWERVKE